MPQTDYTRKIRWRKGELSLLESRDEAKVSRPVRWEAVGKVPHAHRVCGNSLAAHPTASEFDGEDTFFGLVSGFEVELGYFSLSELENVNGPMGLPIERYLHFQPKTLEELMEMLKNERP